MNKFYNILRTAFLPMLFVVALVLTSCDGPEGPAGPAGATGATGANGPAGPAGAKGDKGDTGAKGDKGDTGAKGDKGDTGAAGATGKSGAEQCGLCHNNSADLFAKQVQWEESLHGEGDVFIYGDRVDCAPCHTSEGYFEVKETGAYKVAAAFANPTTINCRTCHKIHTKYDATDWGLTKSTPVKLFESGESVDLGATSNVCGQCHQSRTITAINTAFPADSIYNVTSSRFGPHHGPQANFMTGKGVYKPLGAKNYPSTNVHGSVSCAQCHMVAPPGGYHEFMGGHSMKMKTLDGTSQFVTGCIKCHSEVKTKFNDKEGYWDAFKADFEKLKQIFIDKGWYDTTTDLLIATSAKPIKLTHNQAAALYAFQMIREDKAMGIHNPKLARAMLDNALEVFSK